MLGRVDGTAAMLGDHGYIFLFNPNYRELNAEFNLNASIGLYRSNEFLLREVYPCEGRLLGKPGTGVWRFGDKASFSIKGPEALVLEVVPASSIKRPALLNAIGDVAARKQKGMSQLVLSGVKAETGRKVELMVLLPPADAKSSGSPLVSVNGRETTSTRTAADVVTVPVTMAGTRLDHCQQVGTYHRDFTNPVYKAEMTIPQRVFRQLDERRKAWPVTYTREELLATWRGSDRLLLFIQIADPDDKWDVSLKINGEAVEVKKAYGDVYPLGRERTFAGFYVDISGLKPDTRYELEAGLPASLQPGQFQGLFLENVQTEYTTETTIK